MRHIEIDWQWLLSRRPAVLKHSETMPQYLLQPEVAMILAGTHHAQSRLLFATLWITGARISEALALTPASFVLEDAQPYVSLNTLKRRGRPKGSRKRKAARMVPLRDRAYLDMVRTYLRSPSTRVRAHQRLFPITRQAADARLRTLIESLPQRPSIPVSCHTFRHSFAVNCVLHAVPLAILQQWMGHSDIESTVIYTQVLTAETGHLMAEVNFGIGRVTDAIDSTREQPRRLGVVQP
jgi:site-specific recombinase XerD